MKYANISEDFNKKKNYNWHIKHKIKFTLTWSTSSPFKRASTYGRKICTDAGGTAYLEAQRAACQALQHTWAPEKLDLIAYNIIYTFEKLLSKKRIFLSNRRTSVLWPGSATTHRTCLHAGLHDLNVSRSHRMLSPTVEIPVLNKSMI